MSTPAVVAAVEDTRHLMVESAALAVLEKQIVARRKAIATYLAQVLDVEDRKTIRTPDGVKVGTVSYANGSTKASVTDPQALLAWVIDHYPHNVSQTVRPAFLDVLLAQAKKAGAPYDEATGEIVPGITVGTTDPSVRVTADEAAVVRAWADGRLKVADLVQLEAS